MRKKTFVVNVKTNLLVQNCSNYLSKVKTTLLVLINFAILTRYFAGFYVRDFQQVNMKKGHYISRFKRSQLNFLSLICLDLKRIDICNIQLAVLVADHDVQPLGLFEFHAKLGVGGE